MFQVNLLIPGGYTNKLTVLKSVDWLKDTFLKFPNSWNVNYVTFEKLSCSI